MSGRRKFLNYLAASPLLLGMPRFAQALTHASSDQLLAARLKSAADALNVFELEAVARTRIPPAHWGYLATGSDGETTLRANHDAFSRYHLRARRFVDVSRIDLSMTLFGQKFASPIVLCPLGSQRAFHAEGELAVARAAATRKNLQMLSTVASTPIEEVAKARGGGLWYQLYTSNNFANTTKLVKRAQAAGCPVVAVTVDLPGGRNTETDRRLAREDTRNCGECHGPSGKNPPQAHARRARHEGLHAHERHPDLGLHQAPEGRDLDEGRHQRPGERRGRGAGGVERRRRHRGVEPRRPCRRDGPRVDRVLAGSRAGGGREDSGAARRRRPARHRRLQGAGARRDGCRHRAYIWGLGAFGQAGVERALEILDTELRLAMVGCGTTSLKAITPKALIDTRRM